MDWFLYDKGLRHERVKCQCCPHIETSQKSHRIKRLTRQKYTLKNTSGRIPLAMAQTILALSHIFIKHAFSFLLVWNDFNIDLILY